MAAKLEGGGAYLSSFVDVVLNKLSLVLDDDDSFTERNNLLGRLEKSLSDVGPVLDDAEQKQFTNEKVKSWLDDLQDALYKADDLLDELSTEAAIATQRDPGNSYSWSHPVDSYINYSGGMEKVVQRLEYVVARKNLLHLKESAKVDMSSWRTPSTSLVVSSHIFGRDNDKEEIIKLLLDDGCHAESPVTVIPIVGLGGIGKTTLAQLVYNDAKVVKNFDLKVWVCVAENFDPVNLTRIILKKITSCSCDTDDFESLQTDLKDKLVRKRFLVVLDDVWDDRGDIWEDILKPFQYGNKGSKILLTTRSEKVASMFTAIKQHYRLGLLSDQDCWSVFLKHSSLSINSEQHATLEPIGRKIVEKCKGLPLAVKTLGGLLRHKYDVGDWENILESKIWKLPENDSKIIPALRVSYHYLPSHLKRCFIYCSLFPEDYQFDKNELILLWMAEDLVLPNKNYTLENIGCTYFDELVARSFFQPSSIDVGVFVMHDLMHDLATFFAGKFYFRVTEFGDLQKIYNKTRHLSYMVNPNDPVIRLGEVYKGAIHMRTFLAVHLLHLYESIDITSDSRHLQLLELRCLRALSFKSFSIESLPDSIDKLIHLHYLDLSYTPIVELSESLCKLHNLQTLKLTYCVHLKMLPSRMQDLVNLRHLDIEETPSLIEMPKGMSKLKHLNFLSGYILGKKEENGIRELGSLDNLHGSLCISNLKNVNNSREALEAKMANKKHINVLELKWIPDNDDDDDDVDFQKERSILELLQPHRNLRELSIDGYRGEIFPDWLGLSCYSNLTDLSMHRCKNCRQLPSLGQVPSLQHLYITGLEGLERIGGEFYNNAESSHQGTPFRSLQTLRFTHMPRWREWHIPHDFDGFPKLKSLSIVNCPVLSGDLPAHLPALEKLNIVNSDELACSLPRAPKLHQLLVMGPWYEPDEYAYEHLSKPHEVVILETLLTKSVLECLPHIEWSCVQRLTIENPWPALSFSGDYLPDSLQYLQITGCSDLTFSGPLHSKSLTEILVEECRSLTLLPLGALPNLKTLSISDCPEMDCFGEECLPRSLTTLEISRCQKLERWITWRGLQSEGLTRLILEGWKEVKSFPREGCLPASLQYLSLSYFSNLETLDCKGLHQLTSLQKLTIQYCGKLENITQQNLPASLSKFIINSICPLRSKLEEMNDPRIQFDTD
ncbi:putative disease resistance protein At3g14460 [Arachis ipaensis]|uniref:putative disease resistance protein At3g14460 n=1 Tax=Arachis ipaensis TaxID=130454 RepID=UPI0007AF845C|nr:putative disease resistance protein At3g14460 [Arachis ipaensis]XP_016184542.1 putative disease resistance protein At3g14460 [Arachis ipaensis]XP_020972200.1 putative disease resistance protein At3g14460 [Arachis ipaensis]XP_025634612.1 putative disease resistance protein At3g14460 [Arachis hypogaea]XP_025634613.1 putative disease resistance protein At3g14460 [Arachis hypogaea]